MRRLLFMVSSVCFSALLVQGAQTELGLTTADASAASMAATQAATQANTTDQPDQTPPAAAISPADPVATKKPPILGIGPDVMPAQASPRVTVRRVIVERRNWRR